MPNKKKMLHFSMEDELTLTIHSLFLCFIPDGFNGTIPLDGRSKMYDAETGIDPSLQNVVYFDMGYNLFSGTICNNFGNLASLQGLFLEHNRLVGTIPKALYRGSGIGAHPLPLAQLFLQQNELRLVSIFGSSAW